MMAVLPTPEPIQAPVTVNEDKRTIGELRRQLAETEDRLSRTLGELNQEQPAEGR